MEPRLFYSNKLRDVVAFFTASSANAEYPATNLIEDNYSIPWRSTDATDQNIVADFGSAQTVSAVALGNVNFTAGAVVRIQGHTSDSWGAPDVNEVIDCSALDGFVRNVYHELAQTYNKRYWRIVISDNSNPDTFIEIGQWYLGIPITLDEGFDENNTSEDVLNNVELRTEQGQVFVYTRDEFQNFNLSFTNASQTLVDQLRLMKRTQQGSATPFFFVFDPTTPAEVYFVRLNGGIDIQKINNAVYSARMNLVEEQPGIIVPR